MDAELNHREVYHALEQTAKTSETALRALNGKFTIRQKKNGRGVLIGQEDERMSVT